jgi:hypothetical protein
LVDLNAIFARKYKKAFLVLTMCCSWHCDEQLHLSSNYFGNMVKMEIGKTVIEYIRLKIMDMPKELVV